MKKWHVEEKRSFTVRRKTVKCRNIIKNKDIRKCEIFEKYFAKRSQRKFHLKNGINLNQKRSLKKRCPLTKASKNKKESPEIKIPLKIVCKHGSHRV